MDSFKKSIKPLVRRSFSPEVMKDIGGFGAFFKFPRLKFREPVLVSSSDGVGTKLRIAVLAGKHDTVGVDAVGMNVNDILCSGAEPLFFLDYISFSDVPQDVLFQLVKGINEGCMSAGCSLIGGETAQMPGMYQKGDYDVAGFCVGAVEKKSIIDGSGIRAGNVVIGLESNGLHSNGFSLVRKVLSETELKRMHKELLKPTRIYVKPVLRLLRSQWHMKHAVIKGIAHITGGAFYDKIRRILPDKMNVKISRNAWEIPEIFKFIQVKGNIDEKEMFHTLNMGIGMVIIAEPAYTRTIVSSLAESGVKSWTIGEVVTGTRVVEIV